MTIEKLISAGLDDAYVNDTTINTSGFISAGFTGGIIRHAGMIFRSMYIPHNSIINGAHIVFRSAATITTTACNTKLYGEDSVAPDEYSTGADLLARALTTAYVDWANIPAWTINEDYESPDISAIIQEIIDKEDWIAGRSIGIQWRNNASDASARRGAYGYEDTITNCAKLVVDFTPPPQIVFALSKAGIGVLAEQNPNNFIFNSKYNTFKIIEHGTASPTLGASGSEQYHSISHGLSYTPFVFAFCKFASGRVGPPGCKANNADFWFTRVEVTSSEIRLYYVNNTGGNYTPTFVYMACEAPL